MAAALWLAATGCIPSLQGNHAREPNRALPADFSAAGADAASVQQATSAAQQTWETFFAGTEIRALIELALAHNQELNVRLQEIVIAQSEVSARQGEYWPRVSARVGAGIDKPGRFTSRGASDDALGLPQNLADFNFGLVGSWEIDVFNRLRGAKNAAELRYLSSVEGRKFLTTQLIAEIARSYYELVTIDNQVEILRRNIQIQSDALAVVKLEMQAARVTALAVQRFEAEVMGNRSRISELERDRIVTENKINFLVGRFPQPIARNADALHAPLPAAVAAGMPAQLLENRPDVRQAELMLAAAKLDVGVAKAAFFPSLTLDAGVGFDAFNLAHLVTTPASLIYNVAGNLVAPLLNRQAITAAYRSANARQLQAVFLYEQTVLQAYVDVVNQLAVVDNLRKVAELRAQQVETLTRAVSYSSVLFQSARADYMEVLLTRRDSLGAEMELVETKRRQLQAMVNLYQALGGGWRCAAP